ncbi:MAG: methyltransferase domain-containing protein [Anaerolineae bacterium]|nr:methyltransferase domain-containing protein [Anaerolineae bacterium]
MAGGERIRVYEQGPVLEQVGDTIRPGGLALTDHALDYCALPAGARVLDVGCGPAASVAHLIEHHHLTALGLDPSAMLLRAGRRRNPALPLVQAYGERLPVAANQFDALLTECSLSVMHDPDRALAEFWRVLRVNGYLILSEMYARNPGSVPALRRLPVDSCLSGAVSQDEVTARVTARGFAVRLWEDHTQALKIFTAQLIWAQGSLQQFWCRATARADAADIQTAVAEAKPGYYLLIAQKQAY